MKYKIIRVFVLISAIAFLTGCSLKMEMRKPWESKNVTNSLVSVCQRIK